MIIEVVKVGVENYKVNDNNKSKVRVENYINNYEQGGM